MSPLILTILKSLGAVLGTMAMSLLTGKTFRSLILYPFQLLARKNPKNQLEQELVQAAQQDLGVSPLPPDQITENK